MNIKTTTTQEIDLIPTKFILQKNIDRHDDIESITLSFYEGKNIINIQLNKKLFTDVKDKLKIN